MLRADSVSLQENWHHQDSSCPHQQKYWKSSHSELGETICDPPQKAGVALSQIGTISHRLSGTGMYDPFSCFKVEVLVVRSRKHFLPLVNLAFYEAGLTVKVGRLCFCWSCGVISVMQKIPWCEVWNCTNMGSCSGCLVWLAPRTCKLEGAWVLSKPVILWRLCCVQAPQSNVYGWNGVCRDN